MTFIPENVARKSYKNVMEKLNFVMENVMEMSWKNDSEKLCEPWFNSSFFFLINFIKFLYHTRFILNTI